MKASIRTRQWGPIVGAFVIGVTALGLGFELEGAPIARETKATRTQATGKVASTRSTRTKGSGSFFRSVRAAGERSKVRFGQLPGGGFRTIVTASVDYRDDEGTRLRAAGLLKGPLPFLFDSAAATAGACTFDIQCDDGDPCTIDNCNFPPGAAPGSGKCENTAVDNGSDGAHGDDDCEAGLLCGGCDDGLGCNGLETCQGGSCVAPGSAGPATCCGSAASSSIPCRPPMMPPTALPLSWNAKESGSEFLPIWATHSRVCRVLWSRLTPPFWSATTTRKCSTPALTLRNSRPASAESAGTYPTTSRRRCSVRVV
ncbi:MAG: hypothetical protein IID35_09865, partial [Planctomycetes bacterium]|nr:hypothetical protein [Planctomycetota bacterium]